MDLVKAIGQLREAVVGRLFGQIVLCGDCFAVFREGKERHPCPRCESFARIVMRFGTDSMGAADKTSANVR